MKASDEKKVDTAKEILVAYISNGPEGRRTWTRLSRRQRGSSKRWTRWSRASRHGSGGGADRVTVHAVLGTERTDRRASSRWAKPSQSCPVALGSPDAC